MPASAAASRSSSHVSILRYVRQAPQGPGRPVSRVVAQQSLLNRLAAVNSQMEPSLEAPIWSATCDCVPERCYCGAHKLYHA